MLILQNQCNVTLPKYKESFTNTKFGYQNVLKYKKKSI